MMKKQKLPERYAHVPGPAGMCITANGQHLLTCGQDGHVHIFASSNLEQITKDGEIVKQTDVFRGNPLNCIAYSNDKVAFGGDDSAVGAFDFSASVKSVDLVGRFTSPISDLAFSSTGSLLAMSAEETKIKMASMLDIKSVPAVFNEHKSPVKSMAFDPNGDFVASADCTGEMRIWSVGEKRTVHSSTQFPKTDIKSTAQRLRMCWSPDGKHLALPGQKEIALMSRGSWKTDFVLKGGHEKAVSVVAFSSNGKYLASVGQDHKINVWDVAKRQFIATQELDGEDECNALVWSPSENCLFVLTSTVFIKKWLAPVPAHMPAPMKAGVAAAAATESKSDSGSGSSSKAESKESKGAKPAAGKSGKAAAAAAAEAKEKSLPAATNVADLAPLTGGDSDSDNEAKADGEEEGTQRKRLKRTSEVNAKKADEMREKQHQKYVDRERRRLEDEPAPSSASGRKSEDEDVEMSLGAFGAPAGFSLDLNLQPAFQPGSTPGKRCFLAWNMVGSIVSRQEDNFCSVEITFNDTTKFRTVRLRDHHFFSMAALGTRGAVFAVKSQPARPGEGGQQQEARESAVFYKPFEAWATNSEWTLYLGKEEAECVAVGDGWVALATHRQFVRIITHTNIQRFTFSLPGPVVTMVGHESTLAVVYHAGLPLSGNQNLGVLIMDTSNRKTIFEGPLPISAGSTLTWIGFGENGMLLTMDSAGLFRLHSRMWEGRWTPVLDTAAKAGAGSRSDVYWPVAVADNGVLCAVLKGGEKFPASVPKPVPSVVPLELPVLGEKTSGEEKWMKSLLMLFENLIDGDIDMGGQEATDKLMLPIFNGACKGDRVARALDAFALIETPRIMEAAIKLATTYRKTQLTERMNIILRAKQAGVAAPPMAHNSMSSSALPARSAVFQSPTAIRNAGAGSSGSGSGSGSGLEVASPPHSAGKREAAAPAEFKKPAGVAPSSAASSSAKKENVPADGEEKKGGAPAGKGTKRPREEDKEVSASPSKKSRMSPAKPSNPFAKPSKAVEQQG